MYPGAKLAGIVGSISAGSGAVFSVLPPENATGNWVKVTQRFPVRINITSEPDADRPLRMGATATVKHRHDREKAEQCAPPKARAAAKGRKGGSRLPSRRTVAEPETGRAPIALVIAVVLTAVLEVLDMTIVNVAIPHMLGAFAATPDQITWILTSYIVAAAVVMPLTGYLSNWLGRRRLLFSPSRLHPGVGSVRRSLEPGKHGVVPAGAGRVRRAARAA